MKKFSKKQRNKFYKSTLKEIFSCYYSPLFCYPFASFSEKSMFLHMINSEMVYSFPEVLCFMFKKKYDFLDILDLLQNKDDLIFITSMMIEMTNTNPRN